MKLPNVDIKHILYTTDNSNDAKYAYAYAVRLAKKFDAKITLLHVVQEFKHMVAFDFGIERSVAATNWFSVNNEYFQEIKKKFQEMTKLIQDGESITIDNVLVEQGNPVRTILKVANQNKCDLIVMGVKGRGVLEDAMMGNTVAGVLQRSKVPVLVSRQSKNK